MEKILDQAGVSALPWGRPQYVRHPPLKGAARAHWRGNLQGRLTGG